MGRSLNISYKAQTKRLIKTIYNCLLEIKIKLAEIVGQFFTLIPGSDHDSGIFALEQLLQKPQRELLDFLMKLIEPLKGTLLGQTRVHNVQI